MNVLIVRLGALGDLVHAVPAAAALRAAFPDARIDWLVESKHRPFVDLVTVVDRVVAVTRSSIAGWTDAVRQMRQVPYDVALDFQGLLKSAVLARGSGAARVIGFSIWHLREKTARPLYSEAGLQQGGGPDHVIHKNLRLLHTLGVEDDRIRFPLAAVDSRAVEAVRAAIGDAPFALVNPGAAWPNKRWPPERLGEVAAFLRDVRGLASVVLWGPGEEALARAVVDTSAGSARVAPATSIPDLLALARQASLFVSGDTGPLQIAAAAGTPTVAIFGPTNPRRNGPWSEADIVVSRYAACSCHYRRSCRRSTWCLDEVSVAEVTAAVQRRLSIHG